MLASANAKVASAQKVYDAYQSQLELEAKLAEEEAKAQADAKAKQAQANKQQTVKTNNVVVLRNTGKNATVTSDTVVSQVKEDKVVVSPTAKATTPKHMGSVLPQTGETTNTTSVGYVLALLASILGFFGLAKPKKD